MPKIKIQLCPFFEDVYSLQMCLFYKMGYLLDGACPAEVQSLMEIPYNCTCVLGSIVVSIPACHAGDRGSIPRRGGLFWGSVFCFVLT